jgi:hypothetical protein
MVTHRSDTASQAFVKVDCVFALTGAQIGSYA